MWFTLLDQVYITLTHGSKAKDDNYSRMAYPYLLSRQYSGLGTEADSVFYTQWSLSRGFFPHMCLRNAWDSRKSLESDVMVPVARSVLGDDDKEGFISDLDYSPSGHMLAASSSSNHLFILDTYRGSVIKTFHKPHKDAITKVRFVGEYQFVSGSADNTIGFWDMRYPSKALDFLHRHSKPICSLHYFPDNSNLVSSCQGGFVYFWHLPSCIVRAKEPSSDDRNDGPLGNLLIQELFLNIPNLSQCCFSESHGMSVISNHSGSVFIIHNLSIPHLTEDLYNLPFDDNSQMQLCWIKPNSLPDKRNRVQVVDNDEYSPLGGASVSSMAHVSLHPSLTVSLMRLTTSRRTHLSHEVKDWTCVCSLKNEPPTTNVFDMHMRMYGSNVMEGMLLFAIEETRYASLRDKHPCFSLCGRVIASPDSQGVRLLKFSPNLGTCMSPVTASKSACDFDSLFCTTGPSSLEVITHLPGPLKSVLCCKFSPVDNTLLAVGDADGQIKFYNPKL